MMQLIETCLTENPVRKDKTDTGNSQGNEFWITCTILMDFWINWGQRLLQKTGGQAKLISSCPNDFVEKLQMFSKQRGTTAVKTVYRLPPKLCTKRREDVC
eukprot:1660084-Amphidinium_carterae.2